MEIVFQNLEKRIKVWLNVKGDHFQHRSEQVLFCIVPGMCI